ncbi:2Fe-2S iron-sulfur cluster-binding protein [Melghirimyces algeriensis]|uniref:Ferredoxin n=1 Tax=Melghirimyces algeriensis TaxID=910412 RepID=A0A521BTD8_9BACL|nr:2Fe-2S iron-sulfur cluster-binding protein [Melghirimyces algeriensis]SMO49971.1 Ferredoxin [Melghirimyces algeriensis]
MPQVDIKIGTQEKSFQCDEGENLLYEATTRSIMIPFNCTSGRCGTCRVRILEGRENLSEMGDREALRLGDEQIEKGFRLACQLAVYGDVQVEVPQPKLY